MFGKKKKAFQKEGQEIMESFEKRTEGITKRFTWRAGGAGE